MEINLTSMCNFFKYMFLIYSLLGMRVASVYDIDNKNYLIKLAKYVLIYLQEYLSYVLFLFP